MTTTPLPLSPDTRIPVFVSLTGKVHRAQTYPWGPGVACSDKFLMGTTTEALVRDVTCEHCLADDIPSTWEVRVPDGRYKTGYRVVHSGLATEAEAEMLATAPNAVVAEVPYEVPSGDE